MFCSSMLTYYQIPRGVPFLLVVSLGGGGGEILILHVNHKKGQSCRLVLHLLSVTLILCMR